MTDTERSSIGSEMIPACSVLHLVDPGRETWANLEALARLTNTNQSLEHRVVTIGGADGASRADRAGIRCMGSIHAPLTHPVSASSALRQVLRRAGRSTIVHAWSSSVASAALLAGWRGGMITTLEVAPKQSLQLDLKLRKALLRRCGRLIVGSKLERSDWMAAGAPVGAVTIIARPIAPQSPSDQQRRAIRKGWGVDDNTVVVASLDAPARSIDSFRMVYVVGVASVAGGRTHPVLPRGSSQLERAIRFTERHDGIWSLTVDHREVPELISALDLGVWFGGTAKTNSSASLLELACAQGLSVVTLDNPHALEVCEGIDNVQIVHSHATTPLARAILERAALLPTAPTPNAELLARHNPDTWLARMEMEYRRALGLGSVVCGGASAA